jgi:hypothetical protein
MFARYFAELPFPLQEAEHALLHSPEGWVPGLARDAQVRGETLLADVGFESGGRRVSRQVEVTLGQPLRFPSRTVLPIAWQPVDHQSLFPALDADLEVAGLGPSLSQISISARYEPPLGVIGRAIDRALMHRVAEATLKDFVDQVGSALTSLLAGGARMKPKPEVVEVLWRSVGR